jgi:anthranilate/para-aminobenzoate synthase component II
MNNIINNIMDNIKDNIIINKKILVFLNNHFNTNISHLEEKYNTTYIFTDTLIDISDEYITSIIYTADIIFIGGGPQHLTSSKIKNYPEVPVLIKIINICDNLNKLLIGICLGCQLIALNYNNNIIKLNELHIGQDFLDTFRLNYNIIKNDKYLSKINFDLLEHSFSFHNDGIDINNINNKYIDIIAYSRTNVPYIIKHKTKLIYGFQFHPELCYKSITKSLKKYNIIYDLNKLDIDLLKLINKHFFDIFIKN